MLLSQKATAVERPFPSSPISIDKVPIFGMIQPSNTVQAAHWHVPDGRATCNQDVLAPVFVATQRGGCGAVGVRKIGSQAHVV